MDTPLTAPQLKAATLLIQALLCQTCRKDIKACEYGTHTHTHTHTYTHAHKHTHARTHTHTSAMVNQRRLTCRKQENACWIWPPRRTQGAESIHAKFNGLQRTYHSVPDKVQQLVLMVKEHLLSVAPQNVAATLLPAMT